MRTVLLIDDEPSMAPLVSMCLEDTDASVVHAENLATALEEAERCAPRVILLDLRLPDMDGTDIARALRDQAQTARIPVVALSALRYAGGSDRLLAARFSGYLGKPIDVRAFPDQVRSYCGRASA